MSQPRIISDSRSPAQSGRALLVGVYGQELAHELLLDELESLVGAAGASVVGRTCQRLGSRRDLCAATYIRRGKAVEVAELAAARDANLVVFDNELSAAQIRELERLIGMRVIDRSEVILDIFALRARSREAKLQVELAQLQYTAPRLRGMWTHLERQANMMGAAGLGSRGPGEKQIELDRRIVRDRIARLRRELSRIHDRRTRQVAARGKRGYCVGLVGYTNAGKSTLMRALTGADTYCADQLFATVDTQTRKWQIESGLCAMLSDTVGFVRDLPHLLVASFRSTLEEALRADLLLHVIDASHPQASEQIEAVRGVLEELGCDMGRVICVLNKIDRVIDSDDLLILRSKLPGAICISAATGAGVGELSRAVASRSRRDSVLVRITVPAAEGAVQALVRARAEIRTESYVKDAWVAEVNVEPRVLAQLRRQSRDLRVEQLG